MLKAAAARNGTSSRLASLQVGWLHPSGAAAVDPPPPPVESLPQCRSRQHLAARDCEVISTSAVGAAGDNWPPYMAAGGDNYAPTPPPPAEVHLEVEAGSAGEHVDYVRHWRPRHVRCCRCFCGDCGGDHQEGEGDGGGGVGGHRSGRCSGSNSAGMWSDLAELKDILLGAELVGRTWRLSITWFACALTYYGVVMLVPRVTASGLHTQENDGSGSSCLPWPDRDTGFSGGTGSRLHLVLPEGAYVGMMAAAAAELPSLSWAFLAVDRWSRRTVVTAGLTVTAAVLAPLVVAQVGGSAAAAENVPALVPPPLDPASASRGAVSIMWRLLHPQWLVSPASWWLPLASVLLARLFVSGCFSLLYVLTPEQYPPRARGSALGAANTLARLGALAASFVAVVLPLPAALGLMSFACGAAALAVWGLRSGRPGAGSEGTT